MTFYRGLSDPFIDLLCAEAKKPGWWREVLDDKTLLVGVRSEELNVYWQGQALFTVKPVSNALRVTTHAKFLLDPDLKDQIRLEDGSFNTGALRDSGFMSGFGPGTTLRKMKRTAQLFAGNEKMGCHAVAERNATVIDFEVALPVGDGPPDEAGRIDLACFVESTAGIQLTFWEAKHFTNPELRARSGHAKVVAQVERYAKWIAGHRADLLHSYQRVARNLMAFKEMGWTRTLHPSIAAVAGGTPLSLDDVSPVGLLIFGYDQAQKNDPVWKKHRENLETPGRRVFAVGNASNIRLPTQAKDSPAGEILLPGDPANDPLPPTGEANPP